MKITLRSGAVLDMTRANFELGHNLFQIILRDLKGVNFKIGIKEGQTLGDFEVTDEALNTIKDAFFTLLSSRDIQEALRPCLDRATYNNKKIDSTLLDDETAAEDYLVIVKEVLVLNLTPFYKGLLSLFPDVKALKSIQSLMSR